MINEDCPKQITNPANNEKRSFFRGVLENVGQTLPMTAAGPLSMIQIVNGN